MLLVRLDESSRQTKTSQIVEQVKSLIENGALRPGDALPSTRRLAASLCIDRSTVANAYQELWAIGFIDARPRACPRVRKRVDLTAAAETRSCAIDWEQLSSQAGNELYRTMSRFGSPSGRPDSSVIDFSTLRPDHRLLPLDRFRTCLNHVLREEGRGLMGYGDCAGYPPLRELIALRLKSHGMSVTRDEVLITNGSQHALDLVFRMASSPGKKLVVESPTYDCVLPLIRFHGLVPVEVPMGAGGMDLSVLRDVLERERPSLVYTMPSLQNPTGVTTSQAHREQLLELCGRFRVPVIEDGFDEEMKYFGRAVLPIKSMDKHGLVIYCGTFSKVLFPGMRVGWIVADAGCIERLSAIRRSSELSPNLVAQAAFFEFCRRGYLDRHIAKMHRIFRKRMLVLIDSLRKYVPEGWTEWDGPTGGYLAWLRLNPGLKTPADWDVHFASHGIRVSMGDRFYAGKAPGVCLRLSISKLDEREISEGVKRLALSLRALAGDRT